MQTHKYSLSELIDKKLIRFLATLLLASLVFSSLGSVGPFLIVASAVSLNFFIYRGNLLTLFFAFIFLDSYSLVWGGNWGIIYFDESLVDVSFTQASGYLGYLIALLTLLSKRDLLKPVKLDFLILTFFIWAVLSVFWAEDFDEAFENAVRFVQFIILYFLTRVIVRGRIRIQLYFKYIIACFYLLLPVIILQYLSGYFEEGYGAGRPGDLAKFLPYILAMLTLSRGSKIVVWTSILLSTFLATFHGSRRVLVAILSYFSLHFNFGKFSLVLLITLSLVGPLLLEVLPKVTRDRIELTIEDTGKVFQGQVDNNTLDDLGTNRWSLWQNTVAIWLRNPVFGVGLKNHVKLMDDYGYRSEARAHNFFLEVLADLGAIGLIIVLLIVYKGFQVLRSIPTNSKKVTFYAVMLEAYRYNFVVMHLIALVGSSIFYNKSAWIIYGLIGSINELKASKDY